MSGVDPAGPIFISHRGSDGTLPAIALARRLRSSGVPVWLDVDDLPPGDIATRLDLALTKGLSGAVVVVTPEVGKSTVILNQELPALLALDGSDPNFTFAILNEIPDPANPAGCDRAAPAVLLDPGGVHPLLHASPGVKQYSSIDGTADDLGRWLARERLDALRRGRDTEPLTLDIHTRLVASAYGSRADLVFRSAPPPTGSRIPEPAVWEDIARLLRWLPDVIAGVRPPEIVISGSGHLGIGVALGAGVPETTGLPVAVAASAGAFRRASRGLSLVERLPLIGIRPKRRVVATGSGKPVAIHVDVAEFAGQDTFATWAQANAPAFSRAITFHRLGRFDPARGALLATYLAGEIRREAREAGTTEILLFPRTAWPMAVLIGTLLNTLTTRLYEWDNATGVGEYREVAVVRPGVGGGALIEVVT